MDDEELDQETDGAPAIDPVASSEAPPPDANPYAGYMQQLQNTASSAPAPSSSSIQGGARAPAGGANADATFEKWMRSQQAAVKGQSDEAAQEASLIAEKAKKADDFAKQQLEKEQQYNEQLDNSNKGVSDAQNEMDKYEFKDYWADKSIGQKISAALAIGIGQFGANVGGGPNHAASIINQAVDQHVTAEKMRYEKLRGKVGQAESQYGRVLARVKDGKVADAVLKDAALGQLDNQIGVLKAKNMSQQMLLQANALQDGLRAQRAAAREVMQANLQAKALKSLDAQQEKLIKTQVPTLGGYANTEDDAKVLKTNLSKQMTGLAAIQRLTDITKDFGHSFNPNTRAEVRVLRNMLVGETGKALFSRLNEREIEMLNEAIKNPNDPYSLDSATRTSLQTIQNKLASELAQDANNRGLTDVTPEKILKQSLVMNQSILKGRNGNAQSLIDKSKEKFGTRL